MLSQNSSPLISIHKSYESLLAASSPHEYCVFCCWVASRVKQGEGWSSHDYCIWLGQVSCINRAFDWKYKPNRKIQHQRIHYAPSFLVELNDEYNWKKIEFQVQNWIHIMLAHNCTCVMTSRRSDWTGVICYSLYEPGRAEDPDSRLLTIGPGLLLMPPSVSNSGLVFSTDIHCFQIKQTILLQYSCLYVSV